MEDPLSVASGIAGLVSIADVVFTHTYRYIKQVKNAEKDISELAAGINCLSGLLHSLSRVLSEYEEGISKTNFRLHHINSCRTTLTNIRNKLNSQDPGAAIDSKVEKAVRKLKWPFSASETKKLTTEIERHKATINVALCGDSLTAILRALSRQDAISNDIQDIKKELRSRWAMETHIALGKDRQKILRFFAKIDPTSYQKSNLKLRHPLTGLWLTEGEVFQTWLHTRKSKLWLSGIPGAGKTLLAASVVEESMNESSAKRAVAYFYCDYKDDETKSPLHVLGSLGAQLGRLNENAFSLLQKLYNTCHPEDELSSLPELPDLIETICGMTSCFEDVSIIVDGLDECGKHTSTVAESLVKLASDENSNVRLLILSRDILEIKGFLTQDYIQLEVAAQSGDLELYVAAEIERRQRIFGSGQLRIKNLELKNYIMKALVDRAGGMFRWVACQIDYLCHLPTDAEKRKALTSLPPTLHETYERILDGVSQSGPAIQRIVQWTLRWLINSAVPISVPALCEAISLQEGDTSIDPESAVDEETILLHCRCLIRRNATHGRLELAHFTVQEFLTQIGPNSPFSPYSQRRTDIWPLLARISLTYINIDAFQGDVIEDFVKWEEQRTMHPFRAHAISQWVEYAEHSWEDNELLALAQSLFNPSKTLCFLSWARDYVFSCNCLSLDSPDNLKYKKRYKTYSKEGFAKATELICEGSVTPLHLAATIGSPRLCQWLLNSGCGVNQSSAIGTPLHCSLLGFRCFSGSHMVETSDDSVWQGRAKIIDTLIASGADYTASYRDLYGEECSCANLAFQANFGLDPSHPLITLVVTGAKLDRGLLTRIERRMDENRYGNDIEKYKKFFDILIEKLKERNEDDGKEVELLKAALRLKLPPAWSVNRGGKREISQPMNVTEKELHDIFSRVIRFDQTEAMKQLLRNCRHESFSKSDEGGLTPLHVAVKYESINAIKMLLSLGVDVHATSGEGLTPLHVAVSRKVRNPDCLHALLDAGARIATVHAPSGRTAWHMAAEIDNVIALKVLATKDEQKSISIATCEERGFVPLFSAAAKYAEASVEFLLRQTPDVPDTCPKGLGLVHYVVSMNSIKLLRALRHRGLQLNQKTKGGNTALHFIPEGVGPDIIRLLLEAGVEADSANEDGISPLHRLIRQEISYDPKVFDLLATEESVPMVTKDGYTALHYAIGFARSSNDYLNYNRRKFYVGWLVNKGADLNLRAMNGQSCVGLMAEIYLKNNFKCRDSEFIDFLAFIINGTDDLQILSEAFQYAETRYNVLCWAIRHKEHLVEILMARGFEVDLHCHSPTPINSKDWSAIHYACFYGANAEVFKRILEASQRVKDHDDRGYYLPHLACEEGSEAKVYHLKQLFDAGVDIGLYSASSAAHTPLMLASAAGKLEHIEYLLDHGVDFRVCDSVGWGAVQHAVKAGHIDVLELFTRQDIDWNHSVNVLCKGRNREILLRRCNVLHLAAVFWTHVAQWVAKKSLVADIDCLNGDGMSALHLASSNGNLATLDVLIAAGANIEKQSSKGLRPIHYAVSSRNQDVVRRLLSHGCLLVSDGRGLTPELYAFGSNQQDIVRLLRERDSQKVSISDTDYLSAKNTITNSQILQTLLTAIEQGDLRLCQTLVKAGVSINHPLRGCHGCTPILMALLMDREDIARYLIEEGASTIGQACSHLRPPWQSCLSYKGHSTVHLASRKESQVGLLRLLLAKDIEAGSPAFRLPISPIHVAIACNNMLALTVLLEHAKFNAEHFMTQLGCAITLATARYESTPELGSEGQGFFVSRHMKYAICDSPIETSKLKWEWVLSYPTMLQPHSGSWHLTTRSLSSTGSSLHIAAFTNNITATQILLNYGAAVDLSDDHGVSPLHTAAFQGHQEIIWMLLQHGANLIARDKFERTPVMFATMTGNIKSLELLTSLQTNISQHDCHGQTALHYAALNSSEAFSHLLSKGLSPYTSNYVGSTATHVGFKTAEIKPAFLSLLCNWDLNFQRIPGLISGRNWTQPKRSLKLILRRLPKDYITQEINLNTNRETKGSALNQVARCGQVDALELLIRAGASLEMETENQGTPLIAACLLGRLLAVKYLVRAGAKLFGTKDGKPCSALQAARDFPAIVQWLLVQQFIDQRKIVSSSYNDSEQEIRDWSGIRTAEVRIASLYSPELPGSSFDRAVEIARIRRELQGEVVMINGFND